jgi:hypothetical protein
VAHSMKKKQELIEKNQESIKKGKKIFNFAL